MENLVIGVQDLSLTLLSAPLHPGLSLLQIQLPVLKLVLSTLLQLKRHFLAHPAALADIQVSLDDKPPLMTICCTRLQQ
jgi:hypothetical protein